MTRVFRFHAIRVGYFSRFVLGHVLIWVYTAPQIFGLVCYGDNFDRGVAL
jgi:hypothetical protein